MKKRGKIALAQFTMMPQIVKQAFSVNLEEPIDFLIIIYLLVSPRLNFLNERHLKQEESTTIISNATDYMYYRT